jgi:SPP1 gp7 family putative phage head morphogenesis protein
MGALVARVNEVFDGRRANAATIARTETAPAYNFATQEAWKQSGVVEKKQWLTARDEAVRHAHELADGQEVPLDQPFTVDGEKLDYPGASNASAGNRINCRCTTVPVVRNLSAEKSGVVLPKRIADRLAPSLNGHSKRGQSFEEWLSEA